MNKIILSFAVIMAICFGACAQNKEKQNTDTKKILVAYFSATGTTAELARAVRDVTRGDLYEIVPEEAYTPADLDWNDSRSRSSLEMGDTLARPALKSPGADVSGYDVIFIGYPIWCHIRRQRNRQQRKQAESCVSGPAVERRATV